MAYQAFILLPSDTDVTIQTVRQMVEDHYADDPREIIIDEDETGLAITLDDDWNLFVDVNAKPYVISESKDMAELFAAERDDQAAIAASGVRLEVASDDDDDMEYFNDYIGLLEQLEKLSGAKVWEGGSQEFIN